MKAYWKYLLCAAFCFGALTACEDVPEPYNIPTDNGGGNTGGNTTTIDYVANQDFTKGLGGFLTTSVSGNLAWEYNAKYGAMISGYQDWDGSGQKSNKPGVTYLVSPEYDLTDCDSAYVVINQAINYAKTTLDSDHKLMIRVGEDGEWAELPMNLDGLGNDFNYATQYIQIPDAYMGQKVQLGLKHTAHEDYSSTWEVKNLGVAKGTAPSSDAPVIEDGVGSGTADDPYDVPTTIKLIAAGAPTTKIYTKGIVSKIDEIDTGSYGNATYYISNDGTTTDQLEVFRGYGLGGAKFKSTDDLKVGDEVIVYGQVVYYNNRTMEFTQGSQLYSLNGVTAGGDSPVAGEAKGSGTLEDPYNVVAAAKVAEALGNNAKSGVVYIKGKVSSIKEQFGSQYGNGTFYISDDGTTAGQFYVYRALYLGNKKWVDGDAELKEGDEVIICGKVMKYVSSYGTTLETSQNEAFVYSHNGVTKGGEVDNGGEEPVQGEAKGSGTLADPYNAVAAAKVAEALDGGATSDVVYVKGKVVSIKEQYAAQYGNGTFYISDDGTTAGQFYVYRALYLGNQRWVAGNATIKAGDEVVICGKLTKYVSSYGTTLETSQGEAYLYSLNGVTEASTDNQGGEEPSGNADGIAFSAFSNGDFEAWTDGQPDGWKSASKASSATLSQSTDAHGGSYSVCVGGNTDGNKRLAYQEMALEPGTYTCSFWTKAATSAEASLCPGHAVVGSSITYNYDKQENSTNNKYVNNIGSEWQQVTYSFTISTKSSVCLIIMNSRTPGTDLLVDDFTIVKQ